MKKILLASVLSLSLVNPSFAWYDSYGGFTCGYLDPLTSILDGIFGPPCPPPVAVVPAPVVVERPVPVPVAVPVPQPVPVPIGRPCPTYGYWCW
jgi:hypothetical protein